MIDNFNKMMQITEENLRRVIKQTVGNQSFYTKDLENLIVIEVRALSIDSVIVPKGTLCLSCKKEPATHGIGETKTVCGKCWNKIIA